MNSPYTSSTALFSMVSNHFKRSNILPERVKIQHFKEGNQLSPSDLNYPFQSDQLRLSEETLIAKVFTVDHQVFCTLPEKTVKELSINLYQGNFIAEAFVKSVVGTNSSEVVDIRLASEVINKKEVLKNFYVLVDLITSFFPIKSSN